MRWTHGAVGAACVGAGLLLGVPQEASAQSYRRQSAAFCTPITSTYQSVRSDAGALGNGSASVMRLACPILDDGVLPKAQILSTLVDVYDGASAAVVDVRACVSFWSGVGGACGPAASSSSGGVGMATLSPSPGVWSTYPSDYGYLVINLPAFTSGTASSVHGYELYP
ncbi:hypothetical protein [Melittangium boletus]|uniref:hypothetical protein n=1 Tax=Melittangium boletus TaxID=83453 RepID=UPI003DA33A92